MSNSFIPQAFQGKEPASEKTPLPAKKPDSIVSLIHTASQYTVVLLAFLLPVFFVPGSALPLGASKTLLAATIALIGVMLAVLAALRVRSVRSVLPIPLLIFWGLVVAALASALLSGDVSDAVWGTVFGSQTVVFLGVMALVMTLPLLLQQSKLLSLYTLAAFAAGTGLVLLYSVLRFFAGPVLSFGSFSQVTTSPAGGLNDLAVLAAITTIVGLIALLQLPLKNWMKGGVFFLIILALITLMVANVFSFWVIVGFFGLLFLIYVLARDTLFESSSESSASAPFLVFSAFIVCIVSATFVVAGDFAGARVSAITNVNYIEVRPSFEATMDIVQASFEEDVLLGSGPNRFADVWRSNKDQSINETNFWNIDFQAGYGLVPTMFVTLGLLGAVLIVAFHAGYGYLMYRSLLRTESQDSFWMFAGTASFTVAITLWLITYFYVPGPTVLLITALFTGLSFVSYSALLPSAAKSIPLVSSRKRGFLMIAVVVLVIIASVQIIFVLSKQYTAQLTFLNAAETATSVEEFELGVERAYQLFQNEQFLLALHQLKISQLQSLLVLENPSEEEQNRFAALAQQAIALAEEAAQVDGTSPAPYGALADTYNVLARAGIDGAAARTEEAIAIAESRDQLSPVYPFSRAFIAANNRDFETARTQIAESLARKNNFTPALFLLSQIAVEEGNVTEAIAATERVIRFEPNNPARFYQLGVLLAANEQLDDAVAAYERALQLDGSYANARYMLGLALIARGDNERALSEFRLVAESNPDNESLRAIITEIETTGALGSLNLGFETPVDDAVEPTTGEDGVIASSTPETNLITPINTEPATSEASPETSE